METKCINIRQALKTAMLGNYFSRDLSDRLSSLRGMILRLYQTSLQAVWIESLLHNAETFISQMNSSPANAVDSNLERLEKEVVSALVTGLNIPSSYFESFYSQVISQSSSKLRLCQILPKFLSNYLKYTMRNNSLAKGDFEHNMFGTFHCFQVPYNFYVVGIANKHFGNPYTYNMERLEEFLTFFFGPIDNYKFYVKIARCVEQFKDSLNGFFGFNYNITLTVPNKQYTGSMHTLIEGQSFKISPIGINTQKCRKDGLVIFGRHPDSDIVFPLDEKMIDYAALILINLQDGVRAIDISKKTNIGLKLENDTESFIEKGMLINIAKTQTFHIEDIKMDSETAKPDDSAVTFSYDDDDAHVNSVITLEYIEGVYNGSKFFITTKTRDPANPKIEHIFGCGGGGEAPDFFIPRESGVSRKHLGFKFDVENKLWKMIDYRSTNGTYILLKNLEQCRNKRPSHQKLVFVSNRADQFKAILVGKYVFFLTVGDE